MIEESRKSPVGLFGAYYAARHDLGHYNNCAITGTYRFPSKLSSPDDFFGSLKHALAKTIDRHPELCYGIHHQSKDAPAHLYRLPELQWEDIVEIEEDLTEEGDSRLEEVAGCVHDRKFAEQYKRPGWSLLVLQYKAQPDSPTYRVDILFAGHHGIADGGSCLAFQKTLQAHLYHTTEAIEAGDSLWPYQVPDTATPPVWFEDKFILKPFLDLPPVASKAPDPSFSPWTANPPTILDKASLKTNVTALTVPLSQLSDILAYCRQRSITLTGLVHAYILIYLSKALPQAQTFRGTTPISLRSLTKTSADEIVNHISSVYHDWSPEYISIFRRSAEKSPEENETVTIIAQEFQEEVRKEMRTIPVTGPEGVLGVARILDMDEFCLKSEKVTKRSTTYEVSNVGLLKAPELGGEKRDDVVRLERAIFTQSAMWTGCPMNCSVVSVANGPLTITVSWLEGAVENEIVYGLRDYLQRRLSNTTPDKA